MYKIIKRIINKLISNKYPFYAQEWAYKKVYPDWNDLPAPVWFPDDHDLHDSHIAELMREKNCKTYEELHHWSTVHYSEFWQTMVSKLHIHFDKSYSQLVDLSQGIESPVWFKDSQLNIINSCFQANANNTAIISQTERGEIIETTYDELNRLSNRVANSLLEYLKTGDNVAIIMPMTHEAVGIYLGIIKAACTVVAIPDSFVADEIAVRLRIANVKAVFCQEDIIRDGKRLPLYEKIISAKSPFTIVLTADNTLPKNVQKQDKYWEDFLGNNDIFSVVSCHPEEDINILFSSGTTGEPKAIPWTHTTPIKCASDAYLHHNIQAGDRVCWPTNLGWMMGPWLIFASLINQATMALYTGSPNSKGFGKFIQDAKVNILGVVPTLVKTWRMSGCMKDFDWRSIRLFTSTAERSSVEDMLYLMSLINYHVPIIEYCGGTEIGGAYITGTVVQPCAPAAFTTPALGLDFVIIDEQGKFTDNGEVAIVPPSIGLSTILLNKNHSEIYYENMPVINGKKLRRHGDQIKRYANGFYRLLGRVDDTMKLSGIKISSAEIEAILNELPEVHETAAIAVHSQDGGPSQLIIYAVLKPDQQIESEPLKIAMQKIIKMFLNPLFKIHEVVIIDALPRTASNKVMRRVLREQYQNEMLSKNTK